jgi:cell division septation protein DedD
VAPPARVAPAAASGGGYAVQVSSQRSEGDAQSAFRSLQGKFPSQLGGKQALIKRVDLGAKGIYFRAMVGPFGSPAEAGELCSSLKSAGGSCLVQRN